MNMQSPAQENFKSNSAIVLLMSICVFAGSMNNNISLKWVGFFSLLMLLLFSFFALLQRLNGAYVVSKYFLNILVAGFLFVFCYLIGIFVDCFDFNAFYSFFQIFLLMCFFWLASITNIENKLYYFNAVYVIFLLVSFFMLFFYDYSHSFLGFKGYMSNANSFGGFIFYLMFFPAAYYLKVGKKKYLFFSILLSAGIFFVLMSKTRSVWIACVVTFFVYFFWNYLSASKNKFFIFLFCIFLLLIAFIYLYAKFFPYSHGFLYYQDIVLDNTGKTLLSGRQIIWSKIIDLIKFSPILGYGSGARMSDYGFQLSSHNTYLQIVLQVGFVGLIMFLLFIARIWKYFYIGRGIPLVRLSGAFMIGGVVHQVFEVAFLQNNLSIGILLWLIIAIGMSECNNMVLKLYN